jgi:hypothetical protein
MSQEKDEFDLGKFVAEVDILMKENEKKAAKWKKNQPEDYDESPIPELTNSQKLDAIIKEEKWLSTTFAGLAANYDGSRKSLFFVSLYRLCHLSDGDPRHLWRIYKHCRDHSLQIPEYVLGYMDGIALNIVPSLDRDALRPPDASGKRTSVATDYDTEVYRIGSVMLGSGSSFQADRTLSMVTAAVLRANGKRIKVADTNGTYLSFLGWPYFSTFALA